MAPPTRPAALASLGLALGILAPLPAAAFSLLAGDDARWGPALAAAAPEGFEGAVAGPGVVAVPGATFRAGTAAERVPGWDLTAAGGAGGGLGLEDLGAGAWGASGLALSTRDLAWPYAIVVEFVVPVVALEAVWAAANADWRATAWDASGALIGSVDVPGMASGAEVAGRLALGLDPSDAPGGTTGIARLELASLGGYDWLYLDDLRLVAAGDDTPRAPGEGGLAIEAPAAVPAVPLPPALTLLGGGLTLFSAVGFRTRNRVSDAG